ncbi:hypothetical protein L843_3258 [Mycobacterium intracellulare MIN_061107_1834]|nr:hypothetical protein L843_3258 [Mycobacterium intracellulare MIN_061107_1834]
MPFSILSVGPARRGQSRVCHATPCRSSISSASSKRDTVLGWLTNRNWEGKWAPIGLWW